MSPTEQITAGAGGAVALPFAGAALDTSPLVLVRLVVLGAALGLLTVCDSRERRVPNRIVLPAAALCAVLSLASGIDISTSVIAGATLVAVMLALSLARPDALGMGDVKLALLVLCGLDGTSPRALILALELYTLVGIVLLIRHGRAALGTSLPLAPIIAAGSLLALLL
jgi:leader peptidase (prepilin peptidase)/N-methyltransferase